MNKCKAKKKVQSGINPKDVVHGKKIILHSIGSAYRNLRDVKKSKFASVVVLSTAFSNPSVMSNSGTNYLLYIGIASAIIIPCIIAYALGRRNAP